MRHAKKVRRALRKSPQIKTNDKKLNESDLEKMVGGALKRPSYK